MVKIFFLIKICLCLLLSMLFSAFYPPTRFSEYCSCEQVKLLNLPILDPLEESGALTDSGEEEMITYHSALPYPTAEWMDVNSKLRYPLSALLDSVEGTVWIVFGVDPYGYTCNHRIVKGVRSDLDMEALRVARLMRYSPGERRPGDKVFVEGSGRRFDFEIPKEKVKIKRKLKK